MYGDESEQNFQLTYADGEWGFAEKNKTRYMMRAPAGKSDEWRSLAFYRRDYYSGTPREEDASEYMLWTEEEYKEAWLRFQLEAEQQWTKPYMGAITTAYWPSPYTGGDNRSEFPYSL